MQPKEIGRKYSNIAAWWDKHHEYSLYGVEQVTRALSYSKKAGLALDIGCGAGGRFIRLLEKSNFTITGIDVSMKMIALAESKHAKHNFLHADICTWQSNKKFNFILAWDSLFHLPLTQHKSVLENITGFLSKDGIFIYTFGDAIGEHIDSWQNDTFYYSSIGITENIKILQQCDMKILHLECDQFPENHVYIIAIKQ